MFLFVAPAEVQSVAERFNGAPFDVEGAFWSHRGDHCTFDTMLELQKLSPARKQLSRFADGKGGYFIALPHGVVSVRPFGQGKMRSLEI